MNNHYINSSIVDYLYTKASLIICLQEDLLIFGTGVSGFSNHVSDELDWYNKQSNSIPDLIKANPRINKIRSLVSH